MTAKRPKGYRGSTSDEARRYCQGGHDDALLFALCIGLDRDYENDRRSKKMLLTPLETRTLLNRERKESGLNYR